MTAGMKPLAPKTACNDASGANGGDQIRLRAHQLRRNNEGAARLAGFPMNLSEIKTPKQLPEMVLRASFNGAA